MDSIKYFIDKRFGACIVGSLVEGFELVKPWLVFFFF
jgi:hypothetical protein